jgi:hypothetical protein
MKHISQDSALRSLAAQSVSWDGTPLNISRIARRLGVSRPTATLRVRELEARGQVRLLPFYGARRRPLFCVCNGSFRSLRMNESSKAAALPHYEGGRGYQPMVADEFRDGNVPAPGRAGSVAKKASPNQKVCSLSARRTGKRTLTAEIQPDPIAQ